MHRRISTLVKNAASSSRDDEKSIQDDGQSGVSTVVRDEPLPEPILKVKRVDYYYSRWSRGWKYRNTSAKVAIETLPIMQSGSNDQWKDFSFVIVRTIQVNQDTKVKVIIKSEYILKACKDVIQSWPGISWNNDPLELDPEIFITFYPSFLKYASGLSSLKHPSPQEAHVLSSVSLLIRTFDQDYKNTLANIARLTSHGEITFELLYAILVPRSLFIANCAITGLPRVFELASWVRVCVEGKPMYQLNLESVDLVDRPLTKGVVVGRVQTTVYIKALRGTVPITSLDAYPLSYHPDPDGLKDTVIQRGRKWQSLIGMHHMQYEGIAALKCGDKLLRHNVRSRIIVDRTTFRRVNANYPLPPVVPPKGIDPSNAESGTDARFAEVQYDPYGNPVPQAVPVNNDNLVQTQSNDDTPDVELTESEILLTPTVVFGFSLVDKVWLEFNVEKILPIEWNTAAFEHLVLPPTHKQLLKSLVEAHHKDLGPSDFIKGKGHGLVVNLFGPPGVGKTFSAEATSEHVKRPLYVVGGGDLGTTAETVDTNLEKIFEVATGWKAIVLIDEADVFLERRGVGDLERNAMVAVFLRHVEYYRGILFLTTNRVKAFDEAFLSRIHVALHFRSLSQESKEQVWAAFIAKMDADYDATSSSSSANRVTKAQITELAKRDINGRQIKNAARTAHSLAVARGERVTYEHLSETLDAMDEFTREFESGSRDDIE